MVTMIAAVARNRAIGFENKLLYWLPNDLRRFKQLTTGHTILMGRRTFESLPNGALPNRRNCVLTRSAAASGPSAPGSVAVAGSVAASGPSAPGSVAASGSFAPGSVAASGPFVGVRAGGFSPPENVECFPNWDTFLFTCMPDEEIFIIGGATLYRDLLCKADRLCLTEIDDTPAQADAFFPDYSEGWQETWREDHPADDRHAHAYSFVDYVRTT